MINKQSVIETKHVTYCAWTESTFTLYMYDAILTVNLTRT